MLTEKKKADRSKMAAALIALATEKGAHAAIETEWFTRVYPRGIMVEIRAARGLCVDIDFNGESCQPDTHVISWHMASDVDTCLADAFGSAWCDSSINPHHFRKATYIADGFDDLLRAVGAGLDMVQSGAAFSDAREASSIAKNGTAFERQAQFNAWREELTAKKAESALLAA